MRLIHALSLLVWLPLAMLGGCTAMPPRTLDTPRDIADYNTTDSIDSLMQALADTVPAALLARNFREAAFEPDIGRQWAVLRFRDPQYLDWSLGLQFVRLPTEKSSRVHVLVRVIDGAAPEELKTLWPAIRDAMRAGGSQPLS